MDNKPQRTINSQTIVNRLSNEIANLIAQNALLHATIEQMEAELASQQEVKEDA